MSTEMRVLSLKNIYDDQATGVGMDSSSAQALRFIITFIDAYFQVVAASPMLAWSVSSRLSRGAGIGLADRRAPRRLTAAMSTFPANRSSRAAEDREGASRKGERGEGLTTVYHQHLWCKS